MPKPSSEGGKFFLKNSEIDTGICLTCLIESGRVDISKIVVCEQVKDDREMPTGRRVPKHCPILLRFPKADKDDYPISG